MYNTVCTISYCNNTIIPGERVALYSGSGLVSVWFRELTRSGRDIFFLGAFTIYKDRSR